ncbi:MAG: winged helix-turn-helix transcriptional regulator [Thermomicrobiales bacterium]|nr:winged helix-turn-helix transcriptional regulator [Thermomicrobiales bacterium]
MSGPGTRAGAIGPGQTLFRLVRFWARRWTGAGQAVELARARDVMVTEAVATVGSGRASVNDVARELGIDQSGASRFIDQAVQRGYLAKVAAPEDGRRRALRLTLAGETLLCVAHAWQETVFAELTADWAEADVRQLQGYLERLLEAQRQATR